MNDEEAVQRVQEGRRDAFGPLMDAHLGAVRAFVALRVPRVHLVEEVVHEAFVFAYLNILKYRRGTSFRGWLLAIAGNLIRAETLRFARERANRDRYVRSRGAEARPAAPAELDLAGLDDAGGRDLLHLRYALGYRAPEIARKVGRSPGWVRNALCRLRQKLRRSELGAAART
jgi:DNA-directed RNA polymerase specialized sigma24 family protein